ncbi:MAG TPA: histidine kinase dimerization/phosphoacceptor domain -containing protein [Rhodoferax sp.]|nr:histidine kinase dimerization/phosphoacceptor domain -containing protein [Rhodoferax sp.]
MKTPLHRILAIDDTPANLLALDGLLSNEFDLQFATSGPTGIALALKCPPDLILLDVMMPEIDGFETFKLLAAQPMLKAIPVVFVTALNDFDAEVAGLSLGAADFITKPINATIARQRIRNLIERKREQDALQQALQEKVALLKEVHHRVKNNLQVIASLLRMEGKGSEHSHTQAVLNDMQGRIRAMALLHESIYQNGTFAWVDLASYLKKVATQVFVSLAVSPSLIRLQLQLDELQVSLDQAMPCGMLVSELISNAFKHGFPDGRSGEVCIELRPLEDGAMWQLRVSDNGIGLPDNFESAVQHSLGLQLASSLASQMGGRLDVGPGAAFTVQFKVEPTTLPT